MDMIIVGNGTSILDKENGSKIDSFNDVVRFNSFKIDGYEKFTGKKTTIWTTVNVVHEDKIHEFDRTIVHSWVNHFDCEVYAQLKKYKNVIKLSKSFIKTIPVNHPSTGLLAIYYLLNEIDKLTITGFDWWEREDHHYGDNEIRGALHEPMKEKEIIYKLIDEGRVAIL